MSDRTFTSFDAKTIANALNGQKSDNGFVAHCPAYKDNNPSLSIQEKHGKVLLHFFAGCSQDEVLSALRQRGLWQAKPQAGVSKASKPHSTCLVPSLAAGSPQALWEQYSPVSPSHLYLTSKRIGTHGARAVPGDSTLAIPLTDTASVIHGLQYISGDGTKKFLPGTRVKGHFFLVGNARDGDPLYIAEGFATAASIHKAMDGQVAVAFNAGNLVSVAKVLHYQWPERALVICADDDAPGLVQVQTAALAVGGKVAIPDFGEQRPKGANDFNDLCIHCGPEAVADPISRATRMFHALDDLMEQSTVDPGYVFRPDVVEQLGILKLKNPSEFEVLRAKLKAQTKFRVAHLDKAIDQELKNDEDNGKASMADRLVTLASEVLHNWEDVFVSIRDGSFKEVFVDLTANGRRETWPVSGGSFKEWLTVKFVENTGKTPNSEALKSAVNLIKSEASYRSQKRSIFTRCGAYGEKLYLDLCDDAWRIVEISRDGWRVADSDALGPVRFCRYPEMKPLPEP